MSRSAWLAKTSQSKAPSTTSAAMRRPSRPSPWFSSSIDIKVASTTAFSLIAIVPVSECTTPTFIGSATDDDLEHDASSETSNARKAARTEPSRRELTV